MRDEYQRRVATVIIYNNPAFPYKTCNAIIRKKRVFIGLEQQEESESLNQLSGQISSMLFERKTGLIMSTVMVHDTSFVVRLNPDKITNLELHPGKKVVLKFDQHDIEWI